MTQAELQLRQLIRRWCSHAHMTNDVSFRWASEQHGYWEVEYQAEGRSEELADGRF